MDTEIIDQKINELQNSRKYKQYIREQQRINIQKNSLSLNKKFKEVHKLQEEITNMIRENRGYSNPGDRQIEGDCFIIPGSNDQLRALDL